MSDKACKDCKWWHETEDIHKSDKIGSCRKKPPIPHPATSIGMFPRIIESSWCGEFEAKNL